MANVAMVVTNACDPDPRVINSAKWLAEAGHNVTIHAYDRQHTSEKESIIDGIIISRYQLGKTPYGGLVNTALGLKKFTKTVISKIKTALPDVIVCHDADTLAIGCKFKKSFGTPVVFDMHDLQHTWILIPSPHSLIRQIISRRMKNRLLNRLSLVDCIVTSSGSIENGKFPGFKEWLKSYGFESIVVENRPLETTEMPLPDGDFWTVSHIGRIRDYNSIKLLLEALMHIPKEQRPNLLIAGDGTSWVSVKEMLENFSQKEELNYDIRGSYLVDDLKILLQQTKIMYAMYDPIRGNIKDGAIPVKMFDAASFGIPSIVNSDCLMGELCEKEGLGLSVKWGDSKSLADALLRLKNSRVKLQKNARKSRNDYILLFQSLLED